MAATEPSTGAVRVNLAHEETVLLAGMLFGSGVGDLDPGLGDAPSAGGGVLWLKTRDKVDRIGMRHVFYTQRYLASWYPPGMAGTRFAEQGVELRGSVVGLHFAPEGELRWVLGSEFVDVANVPELNLASPQDAYLAAQVAAESWPGFDAGDWSSWDESVVAELVASVDLVLVSLGDGVSFQYLWVVPTWSAWGERYALYLDDLSESLLDVEGGGIPQGFPPDRCSGYGEACVATGYPQNAGLTSRSIGAMTLTDLDDWPQGTYNKAVWQGYELTQGILVPDIWIVVPTDTGCWVEHPENSGVQQYGLLPLSLSTNHAAQYPDTVLGRVAADALWYTHQTMEFLAVHGRCGFDGRCGDDTIPPRVTVGTEVPPDNQWGWNTVEFMPSSGDHYPPQCIVAYQTRPGEMSAAGALDIVAHEWSHGLMLSEGFPYDSQWRKDLHEGFADVVGYMAEWHSQSPASPVYGGDVEWEHAEWQAGEDWLSAQCWDQRRVDQYDARGCHTPLGELVHVSLHRFDPEQPPGYQHAAGNRLPVALMLLSDGGPGLVAGVSPGQNPVCAHLTTWGCGVSVAPIGLDSASKILLRLVTEYLPGVSGWADLPEAASNAAEDLYPGNPSIRHSTRQAFAAIGYPAARVARCESDAVCPQTTGADTVPGYEVLAERDGVLATPSAVPDLAPGVRLTNGNLRTQVRMPLAPVAAVATLTNDSLSSSAGFFGPGWSSILDARVVAEAGMAVVLTEDRRATYFVAAGAPPTGVFDQVFPAQGLASALTRQGSAEGPVWVFREPGSAVVRTFLQSDGRLVRYEDLAAGEAVAVEWSDGEPSSLGDHHGRWGLSLRLDAGGRVEAVQAGLAEWTFAYRKGPGNDLERLAEIRVGGEVWRSFAYDEGRLAGVEDGEGTMLQEATFCGSSDPDDPGRLRSLRSPGQAIAEIQYEVSGGLHRPVQPWSRERVTRVTWASGLSKDYYLRPSPAGPDRVVEIRSNAADGAGFRVIALDERVQVAREQDERGYVTEWTYDHLGRVATVRRGARPVGCVPSQDDRHCRVSNPEELADLELEAPLSRTLYSYTDAAWPTRPTSVCRVSVVSFGEDDLACETFGYDADSGQVLTSASTGWTWDHDADQALWQTRLTESTLYEPGDLAPAFDPFDYHPGAIETFQVAWLALAQPEGTVKQSDGPLDGPSDNDVTQHVYYPVEEAVPAQLRGRLVATKAPAGDPVDPMDDLVTVFDGYDLFGNATRVIDPRGVVTVYVFDELGRLAEERLQPEQGCDPLAVPYCDQELVTTYAYLGTTDRLTSVTQPSGASVTAYAYDEWGRVSAMGRGPAADDIRERVVYSFDDAAWGAAAGESLEACAEPPCEPGSGSGWESTALTLQGFDSSGQLSQLRFPAQPSTGAEETVERYGYDPGGELVSLQDGNHAIPNLLYEHDGLGRLTTILELDKPELLPADAAYAITRYAYDSHSNLTSVTNPNGALTTYQVDDFGRAYRITSPTTGETRVTHDKAGQLVWREDARGAVETRTLDQGGSLVEAVYARDSLTEWVAFTYDHGLRATSTAVGLESDSGGGQSPPVEESWQYDRRGQITRFEGALGPDSPPLGDGLEAPQWVAFEHDQDGNLVRRLRGCEEVVYELDWAGRPTRISGTPLDCSGAQLSFAHSVEYLPFGPLAKMTRVLAGGPPVQETFRYDNRYRLFSHKAKKGGTTLLWREHRYDPADNLVALSDRRYPDGSRDRGFVYDDMSRLTQASGPFGPNGEQAMAEYQYDSTGNRVLSREPWAGTTSAYGVAPGGQLSRVDVTPDQGWPYRVFVTYNEVGNLALVGLGWPHGDYYAYGPRNKMVAHADQTDYRYNADGYRVYTAGLTGPIFPRPMRVFHYPDGRPLTETSVVESGGLPRVETWSFVFLGDRLLAKVLEDGTTYSVFSDHVAFPLLVVSSDGEVAWEGVAEPFGEVVAGEGWVDPHLRYPGQWREYPREPSGRMLIYNNVFRWYVPEWGRYTQPDPLAEVGMTADELKQKVLAGWLPESPYAYAHSNPLRFVDPLGLKAERPLSRSWGDSPRAGQYWEGHWRPFP